MVYQQARGRARARNGDTYAQPAVGRGAPQLLGHRLRIAEQPRKAAQIERDLARAARLDARREAPRDLAQHAGDTSFRSIDSGKHIKLRGV
jgi:hypothetical protein